MSGHGAVKVDNDERAASANGANSARDIGRTRVMVWQASQGVSNTYMIDRPVEGEMGGGGGWDGWDADSREDEGSEVKGVVDEE